MIVVDASAMVRILLNISPREDITDLILDSGESVHAPHLLDAEVAQVVRRFAAAAEIDEMRGLLALETLRAFQIQRHRHDHLLPRVWALRHNFTAYDALYVALAESLGGRLLTRDLRLRAATETHTRVELA